MGKKATYALGMVETLGLATSIEVADTMLKTAHVSIVNQEEVSMALYTIFVEGDISAVQMAVEAGITVARRTGALIAYDIIPNPEKSSKKLTKRRSK